MPTIDQDQSNMKVGRYSEEERKERIGRYLKKRNQRNFNKTIKVSFSSAMYLNNYNPFAIGYRLSI